MRTNHATLLKDFADFVAILEEAKREEIESMSFHAGYQTHARAFAKLSAARDQLMKAYRRALEAGAK